MTEERSRRGRSRDFEYEVVNSIGVLARYNSGWTKEINMVAWNGKDPKFDIRDWNPEHSQMSRGVTLYEDELKQLMGVMEGYFAAQKRKGNYREGNRERAVKKDQITETNVSDQEKKNTECCGLQEEAELDNDREEMEKSAETTEIKEDAVEEPEPSADEIRFS